MLSGAHPDVSIFRRDQTGCVKRARIMSNYSEFLLELLGVLSKTAKLSYVLESSEVIEFP